MKVIILGSGTSHGVPTIDCMAGDFTRCPKGVCDAAKSDPRHNRTRCSIAVMFNNRRVLIDVSMDFRQQVLRERLQSIDAVLLTHAHADHIGGFPDIRSYTRDKRLPIYGSSETLECLRSSYDYVFNPPAMRGGGIPDVALEKVDRPFELFGRTIIPVPVEHGSLQGACGYRIDGLAYIPDLKRLRPGSHELLEGLDCLIIDALRDERPHSTHMILPESIELARELGSRRTYFTHLTHNIHYELDQDKLDTNQWFAYDGQGIEL